MVNWIKIKNEYINGNISYRKLADKHGISFNTLKDVAVKEEWNKKKKEQHNKITTKTQQKTIEKLAEKEANRFARISDAADKLIEKIELATEQLDLYLERTKVKTPVKIQNEKTGQILDAFRENEILNVAKKERIDRAGLKQLASALKDLKDIQFLAKEEATQEDTTVNIIFEAATYEDIEKDDDI